MIDACNGNVALRATVNGTYVTAENAGSGSLIANRTAIRLWETFLLTSDSNGTISLLAQVNGTYVTAGNSGTDPLIANRTAVGTSEQFSRTTVWQAHGAPRPFGRDSQGPAIAADQVVRSVRSTRVVPWT